MKKIQASDFLLKRRYEAFVFIIIFFGFFGYLGHVMGVTNLLNTIMNTAWDLLMNTVFFIMGITVLSGALGKLMIEFGVVRLLEFVLAPLMRPLFNLPGVASLAGLMTFFSDNPAIISLANDEDFRRYFKNSELVSLTNFGTAFGMGLIVITFMTGFGYFSGAMIGLAGALVGAVGAALSLVKAFIAEGYIGTNEIAVFTAMGMCWSGFLSTHTAMLDTLNFRSLTSKALISHTVGGVVAGVFAHYLYVLLQALGLF